MKAIEFQTKLTYNEVQYIVIDLFSGAGGTSTGIERAMAMDGGKIAVVIAAVNHDPVAIASHAMNHRFAVHFVEDVRNISQWQLGALVQLNRRIYPNAKLVIWASAECTNYSKAKGGQPRDADSRTLPEALYEYVEYLKPDILQVENVVEFMSWGELDENGRPISRLAGTDYLRWIEKIRSYGYDHGHRILNAADFGGFTSRVRYFGQFVKPDVPFVWPEATHAKNPRKDIFSDLKKWKAVKEVLDLKDEGRSIFDRKKPLCEKTLERIYAGLVKFVANGDESFLQQYHGKGIPVSIDGPATAIATKDRLSLVHPVYLLNYQYRSEAGSIEEPAPTLLTKDKFSIVQPQFISNYYTGGGQHSSIGEPCPAITAIPKQRLVSPQFIDQQYGNSEPASLEAPAGTLTQNPKLALVSAQWLMDTSFNNKGTGMEEPAPTLLACRKHHYLVNPQYKSAGGSIEDPCFTLIAKMDKRPPSMVTAETGETVIVIYESDSEWTVKIKLFMAAYGIVYIKMRMLKIVEMLRIMGFGEGYKLAGTKTNQKKFIGNAVHTIIPQRWYEAMARANRERERAAG